MGKRLEVALPRGFRGLVACVALTSAVGVVKAQKCDIVITAPRQGDRVGATGVVEGKSTKLPSDGHLWVLAHWKGLNSWWPQGEGPATIDSDGHWEVSVYYGEARDIGSTFEVAAVVVGDQDNAQLKRWVAEAPAKHYPGRGFPNAYEGCPIRKVIVLKTSHD